MSQQYYYSLIIYTEEIYDSFDKKNIKNHNQKLSRRHVWLQIMDINVAFFFFL